jgi:glc operon protein GlcG
MQTLHRTTSTELVTQKPILTEAAADLAARAAEAEAIARGVAPVIAVVDDGGTLITLRRPDAAQVASVDVAMDKARTAAIFRRPSKDFEDQTRSGRVAALALHGAVSLQGGMPIVYQDQVIGAIGVSGASSADEDQELAVIGANSAAMFDHVSMAGVFHADAETVTRRFMTGGLLLDTDMYKVDAGRRVAAGEVELHTYVTDVMERCRWAHALRDGADEYLPNSSRDPRRSPVIAQAALSEPFTAHLAICKEKLNHE